MADIEKELRDRAEWRAVNEGPFTKENLVEWRAADELSRLREALKPFADEAKVWSEYDETENIVESWAEGPESQLRVCHLRAAARALSEEGQADG